MWYFSFQHLVTLFGKQKISSYLVVVLIGGLGCAEPDSKLDLDEDGSVGRQEDLLIASDQLLEMPEK